MYGKGGQKSRGIESIIWKVNYMFILGDILITAANIIHIVFVLYQWVVIAAVIISWVRPTPSNEIIRTILVVVGRLTDPLFNWIRQKLPRSILSTGLDFTPLIVLLAVYGADMLIYRILMNLGIRLSMGVTSGDAVQGIPTL